MFGAHFIIITVKDLGERKSESIIHMLLLALLLLSFLFINLFVSINLLPCFRLFSIVYLSVATTLSLRSCTFIGSLLNELDIRWYTGDHFRFINEAQSGIAESSCLSPRY